MKTVAKENLLQIRDFLFRINNEVYNDKPDVLSGATIGQHVRHILDFYVLLVSGASSGIVCYDKRERDIKVESDPEYAVKIIENVYSNIDKLDESAQIKIEADFTVNGSSKNQYLSSVSRELSYCIEHSIHHQALIKAGLITMGLINIIDEHFGVAYSTIRYRKDICAQ